MCCDVEVGLIKGFWIAFCDSCEISIENRDRKWRVRVRREFDELCLYSLLSNI